MALLQRLESWGSIQYDTENHRFTYKVQHDTGAFPYANDPVVLNADLTMNCNLSCMHCVTRDFPVQEDLVLSRHTLDWINSSPFMVIVITGGEPMLEQYQGKLEELIGGIIQKGLIIDTNGTVLPSKSLINSIRKTNTLIRVSLDSPRPQDEIYLRHKLPDCTANKAVNLDCYHTKIKNLKLLKTNKIDVSIQSVVHGKNRSSISNMIPLISELSIKQWYVQRFIPSYKAADKASLRLSREEYFDVLERLDKRCKQNGIELIAKRDQRHNSVFLLVGNGQLYSQGEAPKEKILLGAIGSKLRYFDHVSSSDHAERYYG